MIPLEFLSHDDVERYLSSTFPGHAFPTGFAALVHARTEGNPLSWSTCCNTCATGTSWPRKGAAGC